MSQSLQSSLASSAWRSGVTAAEAGAGTSIFSSDELKQVAGNAENPDSSGITTVKEYNFVPSAKLPEVKGISSYKPMNDRTVRFAINVWAGWGPIIYANNGFKPGKAWKTPGGKDFKVELVLIDDPVAMRDAFAAGNLHVGWATLDMVPLFLEGLRKDTRVMPRIYQQVDWSNGGDGIVVREAIKTMSDLRGKTVVLAQNSPSHYFLLNMLVNGGVQPAEVQFKFTQDAFQAAAAFNGDKSLAGVVSWAPDIYNLEKVRGNRMLVTTATANKLIADVWFSRADFAKDNPDIMEGLVRGIFDAMQDLKAQDAKQRVAKLMAAGYSIPESDALGMFGDAHSTNCAENREFFLNQNNPTNFERTWNTAYYLYKKIGAVTPAAAVRSGDGLLGDREAGERSEVREPEERVPGALRADQRRRGPGRDRRDPDEHGRDPVLPQLVGSPQEDHAGRGRQGRRRALRPERQLRRRGDREARRPVRRRAHHDRRSHRWLDAQSSTEECRAGAVAQSRQLGEGGDRQEVLDAAAKPVLDQWAGLGQARRLADPDNHAKNRRVEIKVYPAEAPAAAK